MKPSFTVAEVILKPERAFVFARFDSLSAFVSLCFFNAHAGDWCEKQGTSFRFDYLWLPYSVSSCCATAA